MLFFIELLIVRPSPDSALIVALALPERARRVYRHAPTAIGGGRQAIDGDLPGALNWARGKHGKNRLVISGDVIARGAIVQDGASHGQYD